MNKRTIAIVSQDPVSLKNKVDELICEAGDVSGVSHRLYTDGLDVYSDTGTTRYIFCRVNPLRGYSHVEEMTAGLQLQGFYLCEGNYSHNTVNYLLSRIRN